MFCYHTLRLSILGSQAAASSKGLQEHSLHVQRRESTILFPSSTARARIKRIPLF